MFKSNSFFLGISNGNKSLLKNFSWRTSQLFVKGLLSLFTLFITASFLTSEQFGIIIYLNSILTLLLIFCDFGISASVSKYTAEYIALESGNERKLFGSSSILISFFSLIASLFVLFFSKHLFPKYHPLTLILLPCLFLSPISSLLDGIYRGHEKFKKLFFSNVYSSIAAIVTTTILVIKFKVEGALIALAVTHLLFIFSMIFTNKVVINEISIGVMKDIGKYAFYVGFASISYFMYTQVDILVMEKFGYINEIGYYGIIDRVFYFFLLPSVILGQVLAPEISRLSVFKNYRHIKTKFHLSFIIGLPCSIIISGFVYILAMLILKYYGAHYNTDSFVSILNLLSLLLPLKILGSFTANGFITPSGNIHILSLTTFVGGIINIVLDILLIREYGFMGIFFATLIVHSLCIILSNILFYWKLVLKTNSTIQPLTMAV
jgi:O-antigen/teichoic acid export membrane protein